MKAEILEHAKAEAPRECCGLVAVVKGRRKYFPCENIAETPDEHFVLSGWNEVEDQGEVVAVVHSHPITNPRPSTADRVACEKSELPWFIVNPNTEAWGYCEPEGFELPYVGREFSFGVVDCYTLVRDWYAQGSTGSSCATTTVKTDFGIVGRTCIWTTLRQRVFAKSQWRKCSPVILILMNLVSPLPNHAAIYMGDQQVLHHVQGRLSSRDLYGGYYGKSTACALRHESR